MGLDSYLYAKQTFTSASWGKEDERKKVNLADQLNAFASGKIIDSTGDQNDCFNFAHSHTATSHFFSRSAFFLSHHCHEASIHFGSHSITTF